MYTMCKTYGIQTTRRGVSGGGGGPVMTDGGEALSALPPSESMVFCSLVLCEVVYMMQVDRG